MLRRVGGGLVVGWRLLVVKLGGGDWFLRLDIFVLASSQMNMSTCTDLYIHATFVPIQMPLPLPS
jgi:hypothetical protein